MTDRRLGRKPRTFDPRIPHHSMMKAMLRQAGAALPPLPATLDNAYYLPAELGMMKNDELGDCTCAAIYHFIQLATREAQGAELTESDQTVEALYRVFGYDGTPATDQGVEEQALLTYAMTDGVPLDDGMRHKLSCFVETDSRNLDDVCEIIQQFGAAYIGFEVPAGFMNAGPPETWDTSSSYGPIEGGHAVLLTGFDRTDPANPAFNVISWGEKRWRMTANFFRQYVDEVYGLVSTYWIERTGATPYGLSLPALEALGIALRAPSATAERVDHGALEAASYGIARSRHWPTVEREHKAAHPACDGCGEMGAVQVHHEYAFHENHLAGRPDVELTPSNLTSLCQSETAVPNNECHLGKGHLDDFKSWNENLSLDLVRWRGRSLADLKLDPEWQAARAGRAKPWGGWTRDEKIAYRRTLDARFPIDGEECRAVVARFPEAAPVPFDEWLANLPAVGPGLPA